MSACGGIGKDVPQCRDDRLDGGFLVLVHLSNIGDSAQNICWCDLSDGHVQATCDFPNVVVVLAQRRTGFKTVLVSRLDRPVAIFCDRNAVFFSIAVKAQIAISLRFHVKSPLILVLP